MKNILKIAIFTIALWAVQSCNTDDIGTPGLLPDTESVVDLETLSNAVNSAYTSFSGKNTVQFTTIFTDEVGMGYANGGQGTGDLNYYFNINTNSGTVQGIWSGYIVAIQNANRAIIGAENFVGETDAEESQRLDYIAQARGLRAYAYHELINYFSPDITSDTALGSVLFTDVYSEVVGLPRATNGEIYQLINEDIAYALENLAQESNVHYVSKDFIRALMIRVNSYRGTYTNVESMVDSYFPATEMANTAGYPFVWDDTNPGTECIFNLRRLKNGPFDFQSGWIGNNWASVNATYLGSPFFEMGRDLYNLYAQNPGDVRLSTFLSNTSIIDPNYNTSMDYLNTDALIISKYPGIAEQPLLNDIKIFRVSEMQLLKAEAQIANNNLVGAATTIKGIRDARLGAAQTLPTYANQTAAYKDLLDERRKELAFEGFRYIDIKRLGVKGGTSFERDAADAALFGAPLTLSNTSHLLTLPIPSDVINANPSLTIADQNPGY